MGYAGADKNLTEGPLGDLADGKFTEEAKLPEVAKTIFELLVKTYDHCKGDIENPKADAFGEKYSMKEACEQLDKVLLGFNECFDTLKWP